MIVTQSHNVLTPALELVEAYMESIDYRITRHEGSTAIYDKEMCQLIRYSSSLPEHTVETIIERLAEDSDIDTYTVYLGIVQYARLIKAYAP